MSPEQIAAVAETIRNAEVPDFLNRWLAMTPELLAENEEARRAIINGILNMGKTAIGAKEQQRRDMRERNSRAAVVESAAKTAAQTAKDARQAADELALHMKELKKPEVPAQPKASAKPEPEKESDMRAKKTKAAKTAARTPVKAKATKPAKTKTAAIGKIDRSPLAVGTFIVGGGADGRTMDEIVEHFGIEAHPMRSKIFDARHKHGFEIEHDAKAKRYVGKPPKAAPAPSCRSASSS